MPIKLGIAKNDVSFMVAGRVEWVSSEQVWEFTKHILLNSEVCTDAFNSLRVLDETYWYEPKAAPCRKIG